VLDFLPGASVRAALPAGHPSAASGADHCAPPDESELREDSTRELRDLIDGPANGGLDVGERVDAIFRVLSANGIIAGPVARAIS
jgi:hypothetical protein